VEHKSGDTQRSAIMAKALSQWTEWTQGELKMKLAEQKLLSLELIGMKCLEWGQWQIALTVVRGIFYHVPFSPSHDLSPAYDLLRNAHLAGGNRRASLVEAAEAYYTLNWVSMVKNTMRRSDAKTLTDEVLVFVSDLIEEGFLHDAKNYAHFLSRWYAGSDRFQDVLPHLGEDIQKLVERVDSLDIPAETVRLNDVRRSDLVLPAPTNDRNGKSKNKKPPINKLPVLCQIFEHSLYEINQ
jgi:hypothetical protein